MAAPAPGDWRIGFLTSLDDAALYTTSEQSTPPLQAINASIRVISGKHLNMRHLSKFKQIIIDFEDCKLHLAIQKGSHVTQHNSWRIIVIAGPDHACSRKASIVRNVPYPLFNDIE